MTARNPMKDKLAIVGIGATKYSRDAKRTPLDLGLEAARRAILDAGIDKREIDGIVGMEYGYLARNANFLALEEGLGVGEITWAMGGRLGATLLQAANAVFSGACEVALVVQSTFRDPRISSSAGRDAMRMRFAETHNGYMPPRWTRSADVSLRWAHTEEPYAAWAARYMHDYNVPRDVFGMVAVNNRTNAMLNDNAVMRTPITLDDYHNARMIREPLCILDCDLPVDAAEAIVLTTVERARSLKQKPVYIHAASLGLSGSGVERYENGRSWTETAPWVAMKAMWAKSDIKLPDVDIFYAYDGFTTLSVAFTEAAGYCKPGETYDLYKQSWDKAENRLKLNGRVVMMPSGGSLSQGRLGGFNYYTDAVAQLRGQAGKRQVKDAKVALAGIGSFYHDPVAMLLRVD